jgi:transposase
MTSAEIHRLPRSDLRTRRTVCAYMRAGYPAEEIADVIGASCAATNALIRRMRRDGWDLRRPRSAQHHVKVANGFLRERYLRLRAQAQAAGEDLTPIELGRRAGLEAPSGAVDGTHIQRLLGLKPMPGHGTLTAIPLDAALALGGALGFDPHEIEAHEQRPDPDAVRAPAAAAA